VEDLKGKTALVTGAGKRTGIGYAIARKIAGLGSQIIVADLGNIAKEASQVPTGTAAEMEDIAGSSPPIWSQSLGSSVMSPP